VPDQQRKSGRSTSCARWKRSSAPAKSCSNRSLDDKTLRRPWRAWKRSRRRVVRSHSSVGYSVSSCVMVRRVVRRFPGAKDFNSHAVRPSRPSQRLIAHLECTGVAPASRCGHVDIWFSTYECAKDRTRSNLCPAPRDFTLHRQFRPH
jgi:hypothetical protein